MTQLTFTLKQPLAHSLDCAQLTPDLLKVKKSFTLILVVFLVFATNFCLAQQSEEVVINKCKRERF